MDGPYRLVNELIAHGGPVRSLTQISSSPIQIVSGCQADSPNIRKWIIVDQEITETGSAILHDHWVTALTSLSAGKLNTFPMDVIITGCYDSQIRLYDAVNESLINALRGHNKGIISFSWTVDYKLLSGSWDGTARIWDIERSLCLHILDSHENGVHVLGLSSGMIVTTSTGEAVDGKPANFQIRFWDSTGKRVGNSLRDHQGSIRSICPIPTLDGFATTSNDGTVAVRTGDGSIVASLVHPLQDDGIPPFILDCTTLSTPNELDLVSCGEDGSVIVWRDMSVFQSLPHPCCVWNVFSLNSSYEGDFLTAGNDGIIRYFSRNPALTSLASSEQLTMQLLAEVEEMKRKRRKGPSEEDLAKATKWELRGSHVGKSEGQVMLFNKDQHLIAAQWSMASQVWIEVGEVTATENRGEINGVEYDHVLPVEIETPTGLRNLQLGYKNGENPFVAAQRFIDTNELNQGYLAQIADWISERAGRSNAPTLDMGSTNQTKPSVLSAATVAVPKMTYLHTVRAYTVFDDQPSNFASKVTAKIQEFNAMAASGQLTDADMDILSSLLKVLGQTSYYHSSNIIAGQLKPLSIILSWNDSQRTFPAYDILRLVAVHPAGAATLAANPLFVDSLKYAVQSLNTSETSQALLLTSMRYLTNCYRHEPLRIALLRSTSPNIVDVLDAIKSHASSSNKSIRLAVAYHLLNYTVGVTSSSVVNEAWLVSSLSVFIAISMVILSKETDSYDVAYAIVLAIGNVIASQIPEPVLSQLKVELKRQGIVALLSTAATNFPSTQIPIVVADIDKTLSN